MELERIDQIRKDYLSCPVCLELFDGPRVLPCSHTICEKCIAHLIGPSNRLKCPVCRGDIKLGERQTVSTFPLNRGIVGVAEEVKKIYEQSKQTTCKEHKQMIIVYCDTCNGIVCQRCITSGHKCHLFDDLKSAWDKKMQTVLDSWKVHCTEWEPLLLQKCELMDKKITQQREKAKEMVETRKRDLHRMIEKVASKYESRIDVYFKDTVAKAQSTKGCLENFNSDIKRTFEEMCALKYNTAVLPSSVNKMRFGKKKAKRYFTEAKRVTIPKGIPRSQMVHYSNDESMEAVYGLFGDLSLKSRDPMMLTPSHTFEMNSPFLGILSGSSILTVESSKALTCSLRGNRENMVELLQDEDENMEEKTAAATCFTKYGKLYYFYRNTYDQGTTLVEVVQYDLSFKSEKWLLPHSIVLREKVGNSSRIIATTVNLREVVYVLYKVTEPFENGMEGYVLGKSRGGSLVSDRLLSFDAEILHCSPDGAVYIFGRKIGSGALVGFTCAYGMKFDQSEQLVWEHNFPEIRLADAQISMTSNVDDFVYFSYLEMDVENISSPDYEKSRYFKVVLIDPFGIIQGTVINIDLKLENIYRMDVSNNDDLVVGHSQNKEKITVFSAADIHWKTGAQ